MKDYSILAVGSTCYVFSTEFGVVKRNRYLRLNPPFISTLQERNIHFLVHETLSHPFYTILKTPRLHFTTNQYEMERIDTTRKIDLGDISEFAQDELQTLTGEMEQKGVILLDYKLFVQSDGSIMILDFNKCVALDAYGL